MHWCNSYFWISEFFYSHSPWIVESIIIDPYKIILISDNDKTLIKTFEAYNI